MACLICRAPPPLHLPLIKSFVERDVLYGCSQNHDNTHRDVCCMFLKFSLGISNLVICCCSLSFVCILEVCLFICGQQTLPKTSRLKHTLSHVAQNLGFYQAAVQCMIVLSGKYPRFIFVFCYSVNSILICELWNPFPAALKPHSQLHTMEKRLLLFRSLAGLFLFNDLWLISDVLV